MFFLVVVLLRRARIVLATDSTVNGVSYLGICTHLANARCHADISRSYNRRISSMEDVIIIERRTSRLHQRSRPSSSRSPRECHRSRTEHHHGKRRKATVAFIFSVRLPADRALEI